MQCFEVRQDQEDLWSVSSKGRVLYQYSSEEEARQAALMLAAGSCQSGIQSSVVIQPSGARHSFNLEHTGM
jgi:hypothetical protein